MEVQIIKPPPVITQVQIVLDKEEAEALVCALEHGRSSLSKEQTHLNRIGQQRLSDIVCLLAALKAQGIHF